MLRLILTGAVENTRAMSAAMAAINVGFNVTVKPIKAAYSATHSGDLGHCISGRDGGSVCMVTASPASMDFFQ